MHDFLSGRFDVMVNPMATAYPLAKSGKARALAITTRNRSPLVPEIRTRALAEGGECCRYQTKRPAEAVRAEMMRLGRLIKRLGIGGELNG